MICYLPVLAWLYPTPLVRGLPVQTTISITHGTEPQDTVASWFDRADERAVCLRLAQYFTALASGHRAGKVTVRVGTLPARTHRRGRA